MIFNQTDIKYYLVGGAVRNTILGLPVTEKDYVVVGATPEWMIARGFQPVGRFFPVFLHPETHAEYALARTERKQGVGYGGFVVHADPTVTLLQDLRRRDLTCNAMAWDEVNHQLIDPFGGQNDLQQKCLRHVSEAFIEDPLRILRTARFMATFKDFTLHHSTQTYMRAMVHAGELRHLTAERVTQEIKKVLSCERSHLFFTILQNMHACDPWLSELQTIQCVHYPAHADPIWKLSAYCQTLPLQAVQTLIARLKLPGSWAKAMLWMVHFGKVYQQPCQATPEQLLQALLALRAHHAQQSLLSGVLSLQDSTWSEQQWRRMAYAITVPSLHFISKEILHHQRLSALQAVIT
jgi:tRNA nucleotidyltransferase (CCA-adding enzyme)